MFWWFLCQCLCSLYLSSLNAICLKTHTCFPITCQGPSHTCIKSGAQFGQVFEKGRKYIETTCLFGDWPAAVNRRSITNGYYPSEKVCLTVQMCVNLDVYEFVNKSNECANKSRWKGLRRRMRHPSPCASARHILFSPSRLSMYKQTRLSTNYDTSMIQINTDCQWYKTKFKSSETLVGRF